MWYLVKLKLTVITFGLVSFVSLTVLPKYAEFILNLNSVDSKQIELTEKDKKEIKETALKYYQYLIKGDIYNALSMFPDDAEPNLLDTLNNSEEEFQSIIPMSSKMNIFQMLVFNKEYKIVQVPLEKDLKVPMPNSPNVYYYFCNLSVKYLDKEGLIAECIYMKKIKGIWKIVCIKSTDRYLPYRAGVYDCEGIL